MPAIANETVTRARAALVSSLTVAVLAVSAFSAVAAVADDKLAEDALERLDASASFSLRAPIRVQEGQASVFFQNGRVALATQVRPTAAHCRLELRQMAGYRSTAAVRKTKSKARRAGAAPAKVATFVLEPRRMQVTNVERGGNPQRAFYLDNFVIFTFGVDEHATSLTCNWGSKKPLTLTRLRQVLGEAFIAQPGLADEVGDDDVDEG